MKKFKIIISIVLILLISGSALVYYIWIKSKYVLFKQDLTQPKILYTQPSVIISPLSKEDLTKLWLNGERCPKTKIGFSVPSNEEDVIQAGSNRIFVNIVNVNFTDNAICEDAERIAQLINAEIVGFGPTTNLYSFRISTRTKEELDAAIAKIDALNDPKIEGVFFDIQLRIIPKPF